MAPAVHEPSSVEIVRRAGGGFLEVCRAGQAALPVAHVSGDPEEMGRQYGALLGADIESIARLLTGLFTGEGLSEQLALHLLDACWERLSPHVPERFIAEMEAIARGAREAGCILGAQDLRRIVTATNLDLYKREERLPLLLGLTPDEMNGAIGGSAMSCTMFAVWGDRTVDGKLFSLRNLDWISQTGMHRRRLVTVCRPEGRHAFVSMGYAGVIGTLAGMNEKGISLSEVGAFSVSEELDGIPWVLMGRRVLEESGSLEEGAAIINGARHTIGYNYLVADGDPARFGTPRFAPRAAAFETNHTCCEMFLDDDPKEHEAVWTDAQGREHRYGTPLRQAVLRADTDFGRRTRALQAADNGPGEPENTGDPRGRDSAGSTYTDCHLPMRDMIEAYARGAAYTFPVRGTKIIEAGQPRKIGPEEALTIAATVAHNTEKLHENDWNVMSVVYAPTDLDFWVAYETEDEAGAWTNAPDSGYWALNLRRLLERTPD
jgi:hypothetical protein